MTHYTQGWTDEQVRKWGKAPEVPHEQGGERKEGMKVIGIDPGPTQSAWVCFDGQQILGKGIWDNERMRCGLTVGSKESLETDCCANFIIFEKVAGMGMAVGAEGFETVFWTGRFVEIVGYDIRIPRSKIKIHLCGSMQAKDANIITALVDRFDPSREFGKYGKGTQKNPGPLFGFAADEWQALALAITWFDSHRG